MRRPPRWNQPFGHLPVLRSLCLQLRQVKAAVVAYRQRLDQVAVERSRALARVALYTGPDLLALLGSAQREVDAGHLSTDAVSSLAEVVRSLAGELQRRELLLSDALEEQRYHTKHRDSTGQETAAFWYAQRDVTSRRTDLLRTATQANLVSAELEALLARAQVSRARTLSPTHNQEQPHEVP